MTCKSSVTCPKQSYHGLRTSQATHNHSLPLLSLSKAEWTHTQNQPMISPRSLSRTCLSSWSAPTSKHVPITVGHHLIWTLMLTLYLFCMTWPSQRSINSINLIYQSNHQPVSLSNDRQWPRLWLKTALSKIFTTYFTVKQHWRKISVQGCIILSPILCWQLPAA